MSRKHLAGLAVATAFIGGAASVAQAEVVKFEAAVSQKEALEFKGAGTFHLLPTGPVDRKFVLDGELTQ